MNMIIFTNNEDSRIWLLFYQIIVNRLPNSLQVFNGLSSNIQFENTITHADLYIFLSCSNNYAFHGFFYFYSNVYDLYPICFVLTLCQWLSMRVN